MISLATLIAAITDLVGHWRAVETSCEHHSDIPFTKDLKIS